MDIITGYIGEPHISSEQDRDINIGIVGEGSYVLATGLQMEPEVQTGNEVRIKDGVIMHQGCAASIKKNTYDSVMIANGSQGMKRTDLIVARYQRDAETNIESMNWVVIQGTPAETDPVVPEYVSGDIQAGDTVADMPMYKVHLDGLNITSIEKVFTVVNGIKELNSNKSNILTVKSYGYEVTVAAGGVLQQSHDVSLEGYTSLGVVGFAPNVYGVLPERFGVGDDGDPNTLTFRVRNRNSASTTVRVWVRVLYVKS